MIHCELPLFARCSVSITGLASYLVFCRMRVRSSADKVELSRALHHRKAGLQCPFFLAPDPRPLLAAPLPEPVILAAEIKVKASQKKSTTAQEKRVEVPLQAVDEVSAASQIGMLN